MKKTFFAFGLLLSFSTAFAAVHSVENISEKVKGDRLSLADVNSILGTIRGFFFDDSTGFVGIGTDSPSAKLSIYDINTIGDTSILMDGGWDGLTDPKFFGGGKISVGKSGQAAYAGQIKIQPRYYNGSNYEFREDALVLDSTGNVGVGANNPTSYKLQVNGSIYATSTFGALSDARHKNTIKHTKYGLADILKLRPISFEWNADKVADAGMEGSQLVLIAQEVEAVFPEAILTQDDEAQTKAIKYSALLAPLIQAVKDLNQEVVQLKSEMEQLKESQN